MASMSIVVPLLRPARIAVAWRARRPPSPCRRSSGPRSPCRWRRSDPTSAGRGSPG